MRSYAEIYETEVINSRPIENPLPVVTFTVEPNGPLVSTSTSYDSYSWDDPPHYHHDINTTLTFTGSVAPSTTVSEWHWDFGDGNTAVGQTVTHSYKYASPGTIAHLRVTLANNRVAFASMNLMLRSV